MPQPVTPALREFIAERRANPHRTDTAIEPEFDLVAHRTWQATRALDAAVPRVFRNARPIEPQMQWWVEAFTADPSSAPSVLLTGPPGTLKTSNAWGALIAVVTAAAQQGRLVDFRASSHMRFNEARRPGNGDPAATLHAWINADLVLLDDLGTGLTSEYSEGGLWALLDERLHNARPTLLTTNFSGQQREHYLGSRIASRLKSCKRIRLTGDDVRREPAL